jgi:very-short-patch-repair endonuclease
MGDAALLLLAAEQHGVVSDAQARELGYSTRTIRRRVAAGEWDRPLPRVLRCAGTRPSNLQLAMAATLWAGPDTCVSHTTAGALWQLDSVKTRGLEITVGRSAGTRSKLVRVHFAGTLTDQDRTRCSGIAVTTVTRTIIDLAAVLDARCLELVMEDAFRRRLAAPGAIRKRLETLGGRGRSGFTTLTRLLDERDGNRLTGSAAEVRLERLLVRHGLPRPVRQYAVTHAERTIYVDFAYPDARLAIEFDSLRWHTGRAKLEDDAERRNLLQAAGWDLVTVTATMFRSPARLAALVAAARGRSCADHGQLLAGNRA